MKQSNTGITLVTINAVLILLIAVVEFSVNKVQLTGGWLFLYPILWNLPASLILMPFARFNPPGIVLLSLLLILGTLQWYILGMLAEAIFKKLRHAQKR